MSNTGTIWWTELNTWDAEQAKAYYGAVMGWSFEATETAGTGDARPYYIALKDGKPVAGVFTLTEPDFCGVPEHWFTYIAVDDIASALEASTQAGGQTLRPPFEIPDYGTLAVVRAAGGGVFGMIQPV